MSSASNSALFGLACMLAMFGAYYVYHPLPSTVSEPWYLMIMDASFRVAQQSCHVGHFLGIAHHLRLLNFAINVMERLRMISEYSLFVNITDTEFDGVDVRIYQPTEAQESMHRAIIYVHGGGWALSSAKGCLFNNLCLFMCETLDAVIVSIDYRLVPDYRFPAQYEDVLRATKYFLQPEVLEEYSVDPSRIAISGDSSGGNLAAAVCQEISQDENVTAKFKVQALVYPVLQPFDFNTPSYQQNEVMPILSRRAMVEFWISYLNGSYAFTRSLEMNNHTSLDVDEASSYRDQLDWTYLLPSRFRKEYQPIIPTTGKVEIIQNMPALLDVRAAPMLAEKEVFRMQPKTYILTCEIDVLRDDGIMYGKLLEKQGVDVTFDHFENCFHGCMIFTVWPANFDAGLLTRNGYVKWLNKNL